MDIATAWKEVGAKFKHGATDVDFIRDLFLHQKKTHAEISDILKQMYPGEKGFSERTVRRYCLKNNIVRNRISNDELVEHVRTAVGQVSS